MGFEPGSFVFVAQSSTTNMNTTLLSLSKREQPSRPLISELTLANFKDFALFQVNWVGSKTLLTEIVHRLPCGISAKNQYFESVKDECLALVQQPREVRTLGILPEIYFILWI